MEAGDTLVEVLMAIIVLGIAGLALMAAFSTTISGSAQHRSLAGNDLVLRAAAESAFSMIEQQTNPLYSTCVTGSYATLADQYNADAASQGEPNFGAPSQTTAQPGQNWYTISISSVKFWNSSSSTWSSMQPTDCTKYVPQLITMTLKNQVNGTTESTSFTVDNLNATVGSITAVSVTSISPREIPIGATNVSLTITGSGFTSTSSVTSSASNIQISPVTSTPAPTSTSITVLVTVPATVSPGTYDVTVTSGAVSGTGAGLLQITPSPTAASIQPQYLAQNATGGPYTLYGTGFETGMTVSIPTTSTGAPSGVSVTNLVVTSPTTATFTLATLGVASTPIGSDGIDVVLQSGVGITSSPVLQVIAPPSITNVVTASSGSSPCDPGFQGTADCIIYGSGFESGATVSIQPSGGNTVGVVNSTVIVGNDPTTSQQIDINVSGSLLTATQGTSASVEVLNPDGSSVLYANGFKNG